MWIYSAEVSAVASGFSAFLAAAFGLALVFVSGVAATGAVSASTTASTHSMNAIGAESLCLGPSLMMRVYPPLRAAARGATSANNFLTASFCFKYETAMRRACRSPFLPSVTIFSAKGRTALALASVVLMRECSMRLTT